MLNMGVASCSTRCVRVPVQEFIQHEKLTGGALGGCAANPQKAVRHLVLVGGDSDWQTKLLGPARLVPGIKQVDILFCNKRTNLAWAAGLVEAGVRCSSFYHVS